MEILRRRESPPPFKELTRDEHAAKMALQETQRMVEKRRIPAAAVKAHREWLKSLGLTFRLEDSMNSQLIGALPDGLELVMPNPDEPRWVLKRVGDDGEVLMSFSMGFTGKYCTPCYKYEAPSA